MEIIDLLKNNVLSTPRTLFNIGVGPRPHNEANCFKQLWPEIDIIGLEPNLDTFANRVTDYPGKLYPWALWGVSSIRKFMVAKKRPGLSSMLSPDSEWKRCGEYENTDGEILVSCVSLDQLDEALNFPKDIFLWMDIEGSELEAICGGKSLLSSGRVKWIDVEIGHKPRRIEEPTEDMITKLLEPHGFSLRCKYNSGKAFHNSLYMKDCNGK